MSGNDERLQDQYKEIAKMIEIEGIGYALWPGGYIEPDTDDEELNKAISQAIEGMQTILEKVSPYL